MPSRANFVVGWALNYPRIVLYSIASPTRYSYVTFTFTVCMSIHGLMLILQVQCIFVTF